MTPVMRSISALAAAVVWIFVVASIVRFVVPLGGRLFFDRVADLDQDMGPVMAGLLGTALLIGCATAWRLTSATRFDVELRSLRSSLSVWPGWPLSILGIVFGVAALLLSGISPGAVFGLAFGSLDDYAFATVPLTLAAAAAVTGGRSSHAAAFVAAPMLLILSFGLASEASIVNAVAAAFAASVVLAGVFSVMALTTGRELFIWLAIGFAFVVIVPLPLATGLFTPTELLAVVCLLAVACGLLIYTLVEEAFPWRVFTVGAVEILSIGTVFVFITIASVLARVHGVPALLQAPLSSIPPMMLEVMAVAAIIVAGALLTPVVAMVLFGILFGPAFAHAGNRIGLLLALAGIVAMCLRAIEWTPQGEAAFSQGLSRSAGLVAVAVLLAAMVLTVVFRDAIPFTSPG